MRRDFDHLGFDTCVGFLSTGENTPQYEATPHPGATTDCLSCCVEVRVIGESRAWESGSVRLSALVELGARCPSVAPVDNFTPRLASVYVSLSVIDHAHSSCMSFGVRSWLKHSCPELLATQRATDSSHPYPAVLRLTFMLPPAESCPARFFPCFMSLSALC